MGLYGLKKYACPSIARPSLWADAIFPTPPEAAANVALTSKHSTQQAHTCGMVICRGLRRRLGPGDRPRRLLTSLLVCGAGYSRSATNLDVVGRLGSTSELIGRGTFFFDDWDCKQASSHVCAYQPSRKNGGWKGVLLVWVVVVTGGVYVSEGIIYWVCFG